MEVIIARVHMLFWKEIDSYKKVTESCWSDIHYPHKDHSFQAKIQGMWLHG